MNVVQVIGMALAISVVAVSGNICAGRKNGDQIPDTTDCSSYYVCDYATPSLFHCSGGLLYDHKLGVCNWAHDVTCGQILPSKPDQPKPPQPPRPQLSQTTPSHMPQRPIYNPGGSGDEYYPGLTTDTNSPLGFQCTIDGFYFAPHPSFCEQYFICENRRIHFHQCGAGIHWDYIYLQCDFPERAYCYSNNTQNNNNPPAYLPVSGSPPFIGVTAPVAIEFPIHVETTRQTEAQTTPEPTTVMEEDESNVIVCPANKSFMAHSDCHRYYICIAGLPISISCPDSMAWDDSTQQCTEEALIWCNA